MASTRGRCPPGALGDAVQSIQIKRLARPSHIGKREEHDAPEEGKEERGRRTTHWFAKKGGNVRQGCERRHEEREEPYQKDDQIAAIRRRGAPHPASGQAATHARDGGES